MKKYPRIFAAVLAAALLAGCGTSRSSNYSSQDSSVVSAEAAAGSYDADFGSADSSAVLDPESTLQGGQKIIYTADLRMESTDFDTARESLMAAVQDTDSWLENTYLSGTKDSQDRTANYTVRVPAENYRSFLAAADAAGNVLSLSESAENITSSYIDVQARLTALENQRDRLNELADQAETTADLLEIESQLSDVQYQLENYTRQLRNMDSQISYSTVDIYLREVATLTPTGTSFIQRVGDAFSGGWNGFVELVQEAVLAVIYLWPLILVIALVVTLYRAYRRKHPRVRKPKAPVEYKEPPQTIA